MKRSKQQNDPLWNNGQTTTSEQTPQPERIDPVIEAQDQNAQSASRKSVKSWSALSTALSMSSSSSRTAQTSICEA